MASSLQWVLLMLPGMSQPKKIPVSIGFDPQSLYVHVVYDNSGGGAAGPIMITVDTNAPSSVGPGTVPPPDSGGEGSGDGGSDEG